MVQILVIPTSKYLEQKDLPKFRIESFINRYALYIERSLAEQDPTYLQIIPYVVIHSTDKIFTYFRLNKGTESRLHGKMSIGIGGHVDRPEGMSMEYTQVVWDSAYRELYEELNIQLTNDFLEITNTGIIIHNPVDDVGKVHLGLLMKCNIQGREVGVAEEDKIQGKFYTHEEIREMYDSNPEDFETWTEIALKELKVI